MSQPVNIAFGIAPAIPYEDRAKLDTQIKEAILIGKVVVFTHKPTGIVKKVREWNQDEMGDLTAFESTGKTNFVCPYAKQYDITFEDPAP